MKIQKMATIHFNRVSAESVESINEKMKKALALFPQEKREFLWARLFVLALDKVTGGNGTLPEKIESAPAGRILEVPNNQAADVPPLGGKPKTSEKPSCPKKPNKTPPKKLPPKRR